MKFIVIFMMAFAFQLNASTHAQKVNLNVKNAPLDKVLKALRVQTNYNFYYEDNLLKLGKPVTINAVNESFQTVLDKCFANQPFTYAIDQQTIVLRKKTAADFPLVKIADIIVAGKVLDQADKPIAGATVKLKGSTIAVQTNNDGEFSIKVPEDGILQITYLGYDPQEIAVDKRKVINIKLLEANSALNEVVVVAYGQKQKKIETLGAQASLNVQELKQPVANLSTVLAGRVSGLVGVQRSAEPGLDGADIFIRGLNTTSNNAPLILVDGVERSFSNLDPNDVEGFVILKDASSTSVYGVRGANGVILVTTKKGVAGKTRFNFDYYQGLTEFTTVPKAADGVVYLEMANEALTTRGQVAKYTQDRINKTRTQEDPLVYPNVNWMSEIFNDFGNNRKANMNISGGSDRATFYVSAGLYTENGLFKTDDLQKYDSKIAFNRYNFASRLNINATKTTIVDLGIKGFIGNGNYPGTGTQEIFAEAFETYPTIYPMGYYPNGAEPFTSTGGGMNSPFGLLTNRGYVSTYNNQINSDIRVIQDLGFWVKGLSARALFAFDARNTNRLSRTKSPYTNYVRSRDANGNLIYDNVTTSIGNDFLGFTKDNGGDRQFYLESAISYDNTFGKHHIGGLVLYNQTDKVLSSATNLILSLPYRNLGLVGRATYAYDSKYLAEVSFGYNGAENFAPDKRYGFFPSYAVGWVVSNEKFLGDIQKTFQLLKIRASYGIVGNSKINIFSGEPDARDRFTYLAQVASGTGYSYGQSYGSTAIEGLGISRFASDVTWETEKDINLGLEFKTFNNALYMQVDFFNRRRENIFLQRASVPNFLGLPANLLGNLGINNSKGVDITAEFSKKFGEVDLQIRGTYTYNKNEVLENDRPAQPYAYQEARGFPIGQRFGFIAEGYYTAEEIADPKVARTTGVVQAGDIKFKDLNADGIIDALDATAIGRSALPQLVYGFGTSIAYKGFSLGAFFQGIGNADLYLSSTFMPFRSGDTRGSLYENITDRWTPENPSQSAFYPRLSYGADINQNYSATSSHWLMNGKFLRLKTLDFGYTFPKRVFSNIGVQNMRLYFIGYNLFTISPYKMFDPEMGDGNGTRYPNIKTYSLGLNLSF